eukprot:566298-Rhodomonas_salina.1
MAFGVMPVPGRGLRLWTSVLGCRSKQSDLRLFCEKDDHDSPRGGRGRKKRKEEEEEEEEVDTEEGGAR